MRKHRIRKGASFPHAAISRINNMTDAQVMSELERQGLTAKDAFQGRRTLKEAATAKYNKQVLEAKKRYERAIEKGGVTMATFGTAINDQILHATEYDVVIVDEATKAFAEQMILAGQFSAHQFIQIGDPLQLGNIPLDPQERSVLEQAAYESLVEGTFEEYAHREGSDDSRRGTVRDEQRKVHGRLVHCFDDEETPEWAQGEGKMEQLMAQMAEIQDLHGDMARDHIQTFLKTAVAMVRMYEQGFFAEAILSRANPDEDLPYVMLDHNRRSLPAIVRVLSELIYDGRMKEGREASETLGDGIVQWVDTRDLSPVESTEGTSKKNRIEADVIVQKVLDRMLNREHPEQRVEPENIAVIATYAEQARLIQRRLQARLGANQPLLERLLPRIGTVDAFQGSEADIVFVSMTRSNTEGDIGFLDERRRLGVAVGRAREELYLTGDTRTVVERNNDDDSRDFFTHLRDLVAKNGQVIREPWRRGRKHRSRGRHHSKRKSA